MKLLLCAVNAKYIHSNLAILSLEAYSRKIAEEAGWEVKRKEYTINHYEEDILSDIYKEKADVVVFSCYIWNISMIYSICEDLKLVSPQTDIWLGGPEVSYDSEKVLREHPEISLVMTGEGEKTFSLLLSGRRLRDVPGITWRKEDERDFRSQPGGMCSEADRKEAEKNKAENTELVKHRIIKNQPGALLSMDELPFVYDNMKDFDHKIIYYETSRGCPFACSYCLSSIDKTVRFRSFHLVKKELDFFLAQKVPQVKLVDRTFNCNRERSRKIWNYLQEHDNGVTNFHFEISADLIEEADLEIMRKMRPGLIQLEIGVQSTHETTVREIRRTMNLAKLKDRVKQVKIMGNIHQHLDLIAGLPYEDLPAFVRSFNEVFAMEPDQLQLGFLKVLKGSYMEEKACDYGLVYRKKPVYEVLSTKWLSYDEVLLLKRVEEMTEVYYNSGQFRFSLIYLLHFAKSPFAFFQALGDYYEEQGLMDRKHNRVSRYEILLHFASLAEMGEPEVLKEILTYDLYLRENMKARPKWAKDLKKWNKVYTAFFREQGGRYLGEEGNYDSRKAARQHHIEACSFDIIQTAKNGRKTGEGRHVLFDYDHRNPLNMDARTVEIKISDEI